MYEGRTVSRSAHRAPSASQLSPAAGNRVRPLHDSTDPARLRRSAKSSLVTSCCSSTS